MNMSISTQFQEQLLQHILFQLGQVLAHGKLGEMVCPNKPIQYPPDSEQFSENFDQD